MSIASEISRIQQNVTDSLSAVANKGVVVPQGSNSDDLPGLIAQIISGQGSAITITDTPDEHGGIHRVISAVSLAGDTVSPATLLAGYTAHNSLGEAITGTATGGAGISLQSKTDITPTEASQTITPDTGYGGLSSVQINGISKTYVGTGVARKSSTDLTVSGATVSVPAGYYASAASKAVTSATHGKPTLSLDSSTGKVTASHTQTAGYVAAGTTSDTLSLTTQSGTTITPSETAQTAVAAGKYTLGDVKVGAISTTYVGSSVTRRDGDDLTASAQTVTVPAGYYATQQSKSVSTMTLPTTASSSATSGYTNKATIGRSTSAQYINIPTGYNTAGGYYTISATPNGSVTAPSSISGTLATVSTGTNTLTLSKSVSVTPNVTTAGYISAGTAGNSTVSLTASVTTKAAATYNTSTSDQTISASQYLTGAQTIKAVQVSGLSADKILSGTTVTVGDSNDPDRIASVTGTVTFQTIYSGSSAPSSSSGSNGDIYIQTA